MSVPVLGSPNLVAGVWCGACIGKFVQLFALPLIRRFVFASRNMEDYRQQKFEIKSNAPISPSNGGTPCTQECNQVTSLANGHDVNQVDLPVNGVQAYRRYTFSAEPTLEDIRRMQAEFTDERAWNQFHQPRNLLLAMVGEVGEVSELFQWRGEVAEGLPDWTESEREHLAQELSDVLIYLVELAEKCHVDLPQAVLRKMALNRQKYPASKVHGSAKKYTEYND